MISNKSQKAKIKDFNEVMKNNISLMNIYSTKESNDIPPVYDVKVNIIENQREADSADVIFLIDLTLYKKHTEAINKGIYALLNDFKRYFLENNHTTVTEFTRIHLIKYSDTFVSSPIKYEFTKQKEMLDDLEKSDDKTKSEEKGEIEALNSLLKVKCNGGSARFLFHFCSGQDECKKEVYQKQEVNVELRDIDFKYELIFFNKNTNEEFYQKAGSILELEINLAEAN